MSLCFSLAKLKTCQTLIVRLGKGIGQLVHNNNCWFSSLSSDRLQIEAATTASFALNPYASPPRKSQTRCNLFHWLLRGVVREALLLLAISTLVPLASTLCAFSILYRSGSEKAERRRNGLALRTDRRRQEAKGPRDKSN